KSPGPEDPWIRGLAEHLTRTDAKFYGASWCPHCTEQKKLFGGSERRVPYVECASAGPGSRQTAVCNEAGIKTYPTWVIHAPRSLCRVRVGGRGVAANRGLQRSRDKNLPYLGDQRPALHGYPEPGCPGAVQPVQKRRRQTMTQRCSHTTYFF